MNSSQASYPVLFKIVFHILLLNLKAAKGKEKSLSCVENARTVKAAVELTRELQGRMEAAAGHRHMLMAVNQCRQRGLHVLESTWDLSPRLWDDGGVWEQRPPGRWATSFGFSTAICLIASRDDSGAYDQPLRAVTDAAGRGRREEVSSPQCRF